MKKEAVFVVLGVFIGWIVTSTSFAFTLRYDELRKGIKEEKKNG